MGKKGTNKKYEKCSFIEAVIRKTACKAQKPSDCYKEPMPTKFWVTASCWKRKLPKIKQAEEKKEGGEK